MSRLGVVADDYTGATDVASALHRAGLRTSLRFGPPAAGEPLPDADAVVLALRIRTTAAAAAIRAAVRGARWLGPDRLFQKVCSTFDSTAAGNIGPVADALCHAAGAPLAVVCPAAPEHGRTVYMGHLFVGDRLLSESGMRDHPLTPMRDPDLVRVLGRQTPRRVSLVAHDIVRSGPAAVADRLAELIRDGYGHAVVDAVCDRDLETIATAAGPVVRVGAAGPAVLVGAAEPAVLVGAAGLARAVGAGLDPAPAPPPTGPPAGPAVILAGSCSPATLRQVEVARSRYPAYRLDPRTTPDPRRLSARANAWLDDALGSAPILVYASAGPGDRDPAHAGAVERAMGLVARHAVHRGARRLIVAGGETAGAVVDALGVTSAVLAADEAPGVPWLVSTGPQRLALLLKSGNFGGPRLLARAADREGEAP